jgi:large subunit ribosomal protein L30
VAQVAGKLKITQRKSAFGQTKYHRATMEALGLRRIGSQVVREDGPAVRGMIRKVAHLVEVEEVEPS